MLDTIKGELRIFTREVETKKGEKRVLFNACVGSSKNEDGSYTNAYVPVSFAKAIKKDVPYKEDSFDIIVKEAWFSAYLDKEDIPRLKLFVNKAKFVSVDDEDEEDEEEEKPKKTQSKKPQSKKTTSKKSKSDEDDSLPF